MIAARSAWLALRPGNPPVWIPCAKGRSCRGLMFSLMPTRTNNWTNSRVAGDLKHVTVRITEAKQSHTKSHFRLPNIIADNAAPIYVQEWGWHQNPLQWRHNGRDGVSNHQPHHCLLNRLFRCRSKTTPKLRVTGLCAGNSPVTGEFPAQMTSNAENVSIWWRHNAIIQTTISTALHHLLSVDIGHDIIMTARGASK